MTSGYRALSETHFLLENRIELDDHLTRDGQSA
jgi:hypothetical protein